MALISSLTIDTDKRVSLKCKNRRNGKSNVYTAVLHGDFGGGTVTAQISFDGTNWVNITENGSNVTFSSDGAKNFEINSDDREPVRLGLNMSGSTSPDLTIKVYSNA